MIFYNKQQGSERVPAFAVAEFGRCKPGKLLIKFHKVGRIKGKPACYFRGRQCGMGQQVIGLLYNFQIEIITGVMARGKFHGITEVYRRDKQLLRYFVDVQHFCFPAFQQVGQVPVNKGQVIPGDFLIPAQRLAGLCYGVVL